MSPGTSPTPLLAAEHKTALVECARFGAWWPQARTDRNAAAELCGYGLFRSIHGIDGYLLTDQGRAWLAAHPEETS